MDVLLVVPPLSRLYAPDAVDVPEFSSPPLGLMYLGAVLEAAGYSVAILDAQRGGSRIEDVLATVEVDKPPLVGLTCTTTTFPPAYRLAKQIRVRCPTSVIALGGPHASALPEQVAALPDVDVVVRGEGEPAIAALADSVIRGNRALAGVPGLTFMLPTGSPHSTPKTGKATHIDSLPLPARHLVNMAEYAQKGAMFTSRGCTKNCIFCSCALSTGRGFRPRSVESVLSEVRQLREDYRATRLTFHDDFFTADRERAAAICRAIRLQYPGTEWGCQATVDAIDEDLALLMRESGCDSIQFGVESGSPRILATSGKRITRDQAEAAVVAAHQAGIGQIVASFIIGLPDDTEVTIRETLDFAHQLRVLGATHTPVSVLTPFPGTPVYTHRERYGIRLVTDDWERFTFSQVVHETRNLPHAQLKALYVDAVLEIAEAEHTTLQM